MKYLMCVLMCCAISVSTIAKDKAEETKEKAKQKSERRLDDKIDNAIDGGLDKLEGLFKKKNKKKDKKESKTTNSNSKNGTPEFNMGNMFGGGKQIDIKPVYEFGLDMKVEITSVENGKENKSETSIINYYYPKDATQNYLGIKMEMEEEDDITNAFTVIDNGTIISFVEQSGTKMAMGMDIPDAEEVATDEDEDDDFFGENTSKEDKMNSMKKTGNTKTILGYKCEEYLMEDENAKINVWVAPDLGNKSAGMAGMFYAFQKKDKMKYNPFLEAQNAGMMLEMINIDKKTNDKSTMKTVEINLDREFNFKASEYPQMNIGEMMKNAGKE